MDGRKGKLTGSLQRRLSIWLSLAVIVFAVSGGLLSFNAAFAEADEFQDDQLRQIAGLMETQNLVRGTILVQQKEKSADSESQIIVHVLGDTAITIQARHHEQLTLSPALREGVQTVRALKYRWRLFVRKLPSGDRLVVGQRTDVRDELARNAAVGTLLPLILLIPVLILLINILIHRTIRPVTSLAGELDKRHEDDLSQFDDTQVLREIKPFTRSINGLLDRVKRSVDMQRRFVADAAHELRSPLTALSLQAENLKKFPLPTEAGERLGALLDGLSRARLLLEQLLSLARSQTSTTLANEHIPMQRLFKITLEDLMPMAELKNLDIEVQADDTDFFGQEIDGVTLLKNVIGNAIKYTPSYGRIICRSGRVGNRLVVQVDDSGPGIDDAEKLRVFDPFYRVIGSDQIGSGLGLAIVKTIVERMQGDIFLYDAADDQAPGMMRGLRAVIDLPCSPAA